MHAGSSVGFLFNMIATAISIYIFVTEGLQKLTCGYCGNSCALHNVIGTKGKADRRRSTISAKVWIARGPWPALPLHE